MQFGGQIVLDGVSLDLHPNQTVGLVGANGAGKTTIFRLIAGLIQPDSGTVTISKGLEIGYLPQEPQISAGQTLHDEVLSVFADTLALERKLQEIAEQMSVQPSGSQLSELMDRYDQLNARFEAGGGYLFEQRLGEILGGLGFQTSDYKLPMSALSGGQRCRAALAKLLLQDSQYLLLDEPTNHLDIDAVRWLEKFLAGHHGGAVIVSHDRYLLDRLADRIVDVENRQIRSFPGNYTNYVKIKDVRKLTQQRQYELDRAFIEKERAFITKHMGKQRTAEAKGRLKRLERRLTAGEFTLENPGERHQVKIAFNQAEKNVTAGKDVLDVRELGKRYDQKVLFSDLSLQVPEGQRLGITGPNGVGKTTLLKIILDQVAADGGEYRFDPKASIGYYAQEAIDLDGEKTVVQEILAVRPDLLESQARSYAARFLFTGEDPFKRVGLLSGGEQSRVRLMKIILTYPNVLILDEPTNHLDIASREMLEEALLDFPGTIIAISHDRYFLDRICDRLLVMRLDRHALYNGNYSYYIEQAEQQQTQIVNAVKTEKSRKSRPATRHGTSPKKPKTPRSRFAKLKTDELEALIIEHEARLAVLRERFGDSSVYQNRETVARLHKEFDTLKAEIEDAEAEWNIRAERS